jgi:branched-chain amino acid transport system substrate-binding protein
MKKTIISKLTLIILNLSLTSLVMAEPAVRFGAILPLSGAGASVGDTCKKAFELKLKDLKEHNEEIFLEIIYEDDQMVPKNTVSSYRKLKDTDNANIILCSTANPCHALKPITEKEETVLIAGTSDNRIIENAKNSFLYWLPADTISKLWIEEAKKRNIKRIVMFTDNHEGTLLAKKYFDSFNENQIEVVYSEIVEPSETDFKVYLNKIRNRKFDAILGNVMFGRHALLMKQARSLGIKQGYFAAGTIENPNELKSAEGALEGTWYPQISGGNQNFRKRFEQTYPGVSLYAAAQCYDLVGILNKVAKKVEEGEKINDAMKSIISYDGEGGNIILRPDGAFQFVGEIKEIRNNSFTKK